MTNKPLSVNDLCFNYNGKPALNSIGFELEEGAFLALLGPNGAGKSTLFALLTHLLRPQHGEVLFQGESLSETPRSALRTMGIVFQQSTLDLDLTVAQNLSYHASLHGMGGVAARTQMQRELARMHLQGSANKKVRTLNGGHRRRVEIARALMHQPQLLLLDEATVGLDLETRDTINQHVHNLCKEEGIAVLWATHLIDEIDLEDQVLILHRGNQIANDKCQVLLEQHGSNSLRELFTRLTGSNE